MTAFELAFNFKLRRYTQVDVLANTYGVTECCVYQAFHRITDSNSNTCNTAADSPFIQCSPTAGNTAIDSRRQLGEPLGRAVQADPIKHKFKPPGTKRLQLNCDVLLSTSAFKINLRRYTLAAANFCW